MASPGSRRSRRDAGTRGDSRCAPDEPEKRAGLGRGTWSKFLAVGFVIAIGADPISAKGENPIQLENAKAGSGDWQLTRVRVDKAGYRSRWSEG